MNSDETADDDEAPRRVRFIRARASETFDGQDRVLSRVAYDLQVRVTAHSASCGHPGFVSDDYLEHLGRPQHRDHDHRGLAVHRRMWERVDGGYSVHTPDVMSHRACGTRVQRTGLHCTRFHRLQVGAVFYPVFYPKKLRSGVETLYLLVTAAK